MNTKLTITLAIAGALLVPFAAHAQSGTPNTSNPVPTQCAYLSSPTAKDECVRGYNQGTPGPGANQPTSTGQGTGLIQGTGVGKGQGAGQGVGGTTLKGQGATRGIGTGNKK